ncbi:MAG: L,D-transpeptidase family protein [Verrucomicrobiae bacterium]|nr:L,D-transpeptidase family protein [Verrucomicrobiae bacterium]
MKNQAASFAHLSRFLLLITYGSFCFLQATPIPQNTLQLAVVVAPHASTKNALMRLYSRENSQAPWKEDTPWWPVLLGAAGMAWGIGLHPPQPGIQKKEGDKRTPAGVFKIGLILGHAERLPAGSSPDWPYRKVTDKDIWVDDPTSPHYNQHLILGQDGIPNDYQAHRMTLGDQAYRWLVLIEHNYKPATPYAGSAIFFHVRRGIQRASAGCTVMALDTLENFIRWLRPQSHPVLVQLPLKNYQKFREQWKLPLLRDLPTRPSAFWPPAELGHITDLHDTATNSSTFQP